MIVLNADVKSTKSRQCGPQKIWCPPWIHSAVDAVLDVRSLGRWGLLPVGGWGVAESGAESGVWILKEGVEVAECVRQRGVPGGLLILGVVVCDALYAPLHTPWILWPHAPSALSYSHLEVMLSDPQGSECNPWIVCFVLKKNLRITSVIKHSTDIFEKHTRV